MKSFLNMDFLLDNRTSKILYFDYAATMPIIDYHNHLSPANIAGNRRFDNITEAWLEGDHYKWRAMRTNGIPEKFITGDADPKAKFERWGETVPYTMGNPLYHWTHLELQRYFKIDQILDSSSAGSIYENASGQLRSGTMGCRDLLTKMNVKVICTTDDPVDNLSYHEQMKGSKPVMLPAFRPDKVFGIADAETFNTYVDRLGESAATEIKSFDDLLQALRSRVEYFDLHGCRLSDHGLEQLYPFHKNIQASDVFLKARSGGQVSADEAQHFIMTVLFELCLMYHEKNWVQQFHLGAIRNNSRRMYRNLGPDTGFDSIGDFTQARSLSAFLDKLDMTDQLTRTILYNLNPSDNEVMATMAGNFNDGSIPGKVQFGAAWWFLDQKEGMEAQMTTLANMGLLSRFVGMLTDSRSFLSFPRHEYFRRILCNMLGEMVEKGLLPGDITWLGKMVQDICFHNSKEYFALKAYC